MTTPCHTPTRCPLLLGKGTCGHKVLYGPEACWRRDGRPERCAGLENEKSPFAGGETEGSCVLDDPERRAQRAERMRRAAMEGK